MTWLILVLLVAAAIYLLRKKPATEPQTQDISPRPRDYSLASPAEISTANDELLAVLTAAVAEFEGTEYFQVLSIRQSRNWTLTGRQELLHGRL